MSAATDILSAGEAELAARRAARRESTLAGIRKAKKFLEIVGLGWVAPLAFMALGEDAKRNARELWRQLAVPLIAIVIFLGLWAWLAPKVQTSLGELPGPAQVWQQTKVLWADHITEREKRAAFFVRQEKRNAAILAENPDAEVRIFPYTGKPTFIDQILTSLETVFTGFVFATIVAVPLGVLCGLFASFNSAFNPIVQIFKPVSPLAWLPIVTMVVSALYVSDDPLFPKSFLV